MKTQELKSYLPQRWDPVASCVTPDFVFVGLPFDVTIRCWKVL